MKKVKRTEKRNFDNLISKLSVNEILDSQEMICVRGGDGDGTTVPPFPPPPPR